MSLPEVEDNNKYSETQFRAPDNINADDYDLKMWEEPPKVEKKPIRNAVPLHYGKRYGKYTYTVFSDDTIEITRYSGKSRNITIPDTIDGKLVTTIGDGAFYYLNWISSITVPESVIYIGDRAFARCTLLSNIIIPKSVKIIGEHAFDHTSWLKDHSEEFVIVGDGVLIAYKGKNGDVRIPDTVKSISSAFFRMGRLTSLIIPGSVKFMADYAFMFCRNMKTLVVEDGVEIISDCAFAGCTGLQNAVIGKNVKRIGDYAFWKCNHLEIVTLGDGIEEFGIGIFWICIGLKELIIPNTVKNIGRWAFYHCINLESLTIPQSVKGFGFYLFQACDKLTVFCFRGTASESYVKAAGVDYKYIA